MIGRTGDGHKSKCIPKYDRTRMDTTDKGHTGCNRTHKPAPATEAKYREAVELYAATELTCVEISRRCAVSLAGFKGYICKYRRDLLLSRYGIRCDPEKAAGIGMGQRRSQRPATRAKYREAVAACDSMDYIGYNVSQIARCFGLDGTSLGKQLRTHYPGVIERREQMRRRLGLDDNLPRGARPWSKEQYAGAVELLRGDRYITVLEVAERCGVSYTGLEQHLIFYHKELIDNRINIRKQAVGQRRKGGITGRGSVHAPKPATVEKYAEALHLYRTTPLSARKIAKQTGLSIKGFYEYLQKWHPDLICKRKGIPYEEGQSVDFSKARKYNPATKVKYADAIRRLKQSDLTTAAVAAEFRLQPEAFRGYLKEHEPELYARQGMTKTANGRAVSRRSMAKYAEAVRQYGTTSGSLKSLARQFGLNDCSLGQFIKRHFPEAVEGHRRAVERERECKAAGANAVSVPVSSPSALPVTAVNYRDAGPSRREGKACTGRLKAEADAPRESRPSHFTAMTRKESKAVRHG